MNRYSIQISTKADKSISRLESVTQTRILRAINDLANDPRPPGVKKLKFKTNHYRIRVGDYRIIYSIEDDILRILVIRVGHRQDVYE